MSSLVLCGPGTVLTGASLTALTVMVTVSVSESALPRAAVALVVGDDLQAGRAVEVGGGVNARPFRAALMLAIVPVKVIVASAVPSPAVNVRPVVPLSVIVPLVAVSVT